VNTVRAAFGILRDLQHSAPARGPQEWKEQFGTLLSMPDEVLLDPAVLEYFYEVCKIARHVWYDAGRIIALRKSRDPVEIAGLAEKTERGVYVNNEAWLQGNRRLQALGFVGGCYATQAVTNAPWVWAARSADSVLYVRRTVEEEGRVEVTRHHPATDPTPEVARWTGSKMTWLGDEGESFSLIQGLSSLFLSGPSVPRFEKRGETWTPTSVLSISDALLAKLRKADEGLYGWLSGQLLQRYYRTTNPFWTDLAVRVSSHP